jgi:Polysaccharide biosynthesis
MVLIPYNGISCRFNLLISLTSYFQLWRNFCEKFKWVEDFSYGTLLRLDCSKEYSEINSTLVARIQFLAIELARNREGNNTRFRAQFAPPHSC